ncbi:MAG: TetR/AcrR family transcriptional regulator C-terminal domain-containing protein [Lawsonibacter sp.]|nr:TetR/AcrR family transcriptional regulator C-terminal domain-containing protein [Lawsonibacter sp.]
MGEGRTNQTTQAIEASLRKLLKDKPLDKITVKDVVEDCGVTRQTFYYHFKDIYDVVDWRFQQVTEELMQRMDPMDHKKNLEIIRKLMQEHRTMLLHTYRAFPRSYVDHQLTQWAKPVLNATIEERAQGYSIRPDRVEFIQDLYVFGLVSILLTWLDRGMPDKIVERMDCFELLLEGSLDDLLERFSQ